MVEGAIEPRKLGGGGTVDGVVDRARELRRRTRVLLADWSLGAAEVDGKPGPETRGACERTRGWAWDDEGMCESVSRLIALSEICSSVCRGWPGDTFTGLSRFWHGRSRSPSERPAIPRLSLLSESIVRQISRLTILRVI